MRGRSHTTRTRVRFGETDAAGIVFYPTFYAWFDLGTHGLLRAAFGEVRDGAGRTHWPFPIVEAGAKFFGPLHFDEPIEIRSTIVEIGTSSLRVDHIVLRDNEEIARGFEVRVLTRRDDAGRMRSAPFPPEMRDALADSQATEEEIA